jgi:TolB-like protein/DNA-binding winged helix-turn-helix (wHTH) protein
MTKSAEWYRIGSLEFDPETGSLRDPSGCLVTLRPQVASVLKALLDREGQLVTKEELLDDIWKDVHVTDDSLVQCVSEIRKALGADESGMLVTIPRKGYLLRNRSPAAPRFRLWARPSLWAATFTIFAGLALAVWLITGPPLKDATKTIAVFPFLNISEDEDQVYFSDGLAEDLLTDLSKIHSLSVIASASTFIHRDRREDLLEAARALGATHMIDGSVRRHADGLRVSVQLVETQSGVSLWSERYDRKLVDVFAVQDTLRSEIIKALAIELAPNEEKLLAQRKAHDFTAYDLLLRGRHAEAQFTRSGIAEAISLYERAVKVDPNYSLAHARLANMYDFAARFGWSDDARAARKKSLELSRKAVDLDPISPFAHWTYGRIISRLSPDGMAGQEKAVAALRTALKINPNYADAFAFISLLYIGQGKPAEAQAAMEQAMKLNPVHPFWYDQNRAIIHYMQGDFEAAVADMEVAVEKNATAVFVRWWLAAAYAQAGRLSDADWEVQELQALGNRSTAEEIVASNAILTHPANRELFLDGLRKAGIR